MVETIAAPSNSTEFEHYQKVYPGSLECLCSQVSLEYRAIIPQLDVESFHPICDSAFTKPAWISFLRTYAEFMMAQSSLDYRQWIISFFSLLQKLCSIARDQVSQTLLTFLSSSMVISRFNSFHQIRTAIEHDHHSPSERAADSVQANCWLDSCKSTRQYVVQCSVVELAVLREERQSKCRGSVGPSTSVV